jgi:allophanate hydrolase subunit 1
VSALPAEVPRMRSPRTRIPPGSVAVSGRQSMIYPVPSPGGWRLLGRTPVTLFDLADPDLVTYRPGDRVRFVPIEADDWDDHTGRLVPDGPA